MTTLQREHLREAIACKSVSYEDLVQSIHHSLETAMQAADYGDWRPCYEAAQYVADVAKMLARR